MNPAALTDVEQQTICATIDRVLKLHHVRGAAVGAIAVRRGLREHGHTPDVTRHATASLFNSIHTEQLRERRAFREFFDGPVFTDAAFRLEKKGHLAECLAYTHKLGWELRLEVGSLFRTQVCRSQDELLETAEKWRTGLVGKGWR